MQWVAAMSSQPGFEVVAVQALRNTLMSATISASTAALAVMGTVSLAGSSLAGKVRAGRDRTNCCISACRLCLS